MLSKYFTKNEIEALVIETEDEATEDYLYNLLDLKELMEARERRLRRHRLKEVREAVAKIEHFKKLIRISEKSARAYKNCIKKENIMRMKAKS